MLRAAVIGLQAGEAQVRRRLDRAGKRERGFARRDAAAAHADLELDVGVDRGAGARGRRLDVTRIARIVDADADLRALGERGEALELARADDLVRDQHVRDAALHERLGLRHLLAAHPDRASRDLAFRDLRAFVRLGVRAHAHAPRDRVGKALEIRLESVEIDDQRRRIHLLQAHALFRRCPHAHVLALRCRKPK